ncbi:MAG: hypothetical protein IJS60_01500 [Abditibacteriota bacterium]|nr:hypothetical protein [Abditibacteriota bacterium]
MNRYFLCIIVLILGFSSYAYCDKTIFDYMSIANSNQYMMPERETPEEDAFETPREVITNYRRLIIKTAKEYHIEPELLASVIFTETYGGGVSGWYELKNRLSLTKQFLFGKATIGITQVSPENEKDFEMIILYNSDILWQLNQGARQLSSIRDAIYPNTTILSDERMAMVLRYYNQGTRQELMDYSLESEPVAHYALAHYKKNLRIRKRIRLNKDEPYYSNEITQYSQKYKAVEVYVFGVLVAKYRIGGSRSKANNYAYIAYSNRERIKNWLYGF